MSHEYLTNHAKREAPLLIMSVCPVSYKTCGGCGTIWNQLGVLITCPKCSGLGEDRRTPTFILPKQEDNVREIRDNLSSS